MLERLKHDLMTAIQPYNQTDKRFTYNLNEDDLKMRRKKASNYNKAYKDLQAGNYRICLMNCQIQYRKYFTGNHDNPKLYDQRPVHTLWESVHCWKPGVMRMMIPPFKDSFRNFLRAGRPEMFFDLADEVCAQVYGGDVPETFTDYRMRGDVIASKRVRVIRRGKQARMGNEKEKEDLRRNPDRVETDDDMAEAEKTGFLPVNSDLLDIRNEVLFPK
ncbi:MAG: hypothetical protein Q9192_005538 [Flavoplaca navasiana]